MKKNIHKILFVSTIVVLLLLLVQTFTNFVYVKPLAGVTVEVEKPKLTLPNYIDGSFQSNLENYCREHCGFREWFIRLYNQYLWNCFHESNNPTVMRGKDNWLYEEVYVRDHYESLMYKYTQDTAEMRNFYETEALRLWKVQALLEELNIHIFVNINPGKDVICPEYLPKNKLYLHPEGLRAYDYLIKRFDELGINYIDNVPVFKAIKNSVDYPLFYQTGTHWSNIAAVHVFDSILRYMENLSGQQLYHLEIGEKYQAKPRKPDQDLEELLNLAFPMKSSPYWYADVTVKEDSTAVKPFLLTIGDSYFWNFAYNVPLQDLFRGHPYWYYNYIVYYDSANTSTLDLDLEQELMRADYIMLNYGTTSLYEFASRFLSRALLYLCYDKASIDAAVHGLIENIKSDPKRYAEIKKNAENDREDLNQALYNIALYLIKENPEIYFEDLQGEKMPISRNKDLPSLRKALSSRQP